MTFENFIDFIFEGRKAEEIIEKFSYEKYGYYNNVECTDDKVYHDQDLFTFLEDLGAEITSYEDGYVIIKTTGGKVYRIEAEDISNRFGDDLPDETILYFNKNSITKVSC